MSCPYFYPLTPRIEGAGPQHAMLPLGDLWAGVCRANADEPWCPDDASLKLLCNLGYARGVCERFPGTDGPDAVRFAIREDDGARLGIYYVLERDHHPFAHGPLEFSMTCEALLGASPGGTVTRQALAYIESYRRRKLEALAGCAASE